MSDIRRVGFIGLGLMGLPMCRNLLLAGYELTVWNRTAEKARDLAGARVAHTPADVTDASDIILSCLGTVAASDDCFASAFSRARTGQIFVDLGTVGPDAARRLGEAAAQRGASFLDAPVSGGPEGAEAASLTIMVGGDAAAFHRAEPVLRAIGKHVHRMGDVGAGSVTKLVNQLLCFVHAQCAAEAITFGERAGVNAEALLEVMRTSFGQSRMLERSVLRFLDGNYVAGAPLRLYDKDLALVHDVATRCGMTLPLGEVATAAVRQATERGLAEQDIAALFKLYEEGQGSGVREHDRSLIPDP
jgi:3-hydroxyisobutyrate dehydrogenase-like beta-hydroxyacid dehydrogenase